MFEMIVPALLAFAVLTVGLLIYIAAFKKSTPGNSQEQFDRIDRALREELGQNRKESSENFSILRSEVAASVSLLTNSVRDQIGQMADQQATTFATFAGHVQSLKEELLRSVDGFEKQQSAGITLIRTDLNERLTELKTESNVSSSSMRDETGKTLQTLSAHLEKRLDSFSNSQKDQLSQFSRQLELVSTSMSNRLQESQTLATESMSTFKIELTNRLSDQRIQLQEFTKAVGEMAQSNSDRNIQLKDAVEKKLFELQEANGKKLEEMRQTVDEKLHGTLERRLGESFKLVSDRLELVQKGLGEMQTLALGVGDLKKVLTNVKSRGTWGEIQLGALLDEMLSPEQFARNVKIRPRSPETVEFAVKLPGQEEQGPPVYLPIDSKFPKEDFERLQQAQERADIEGLDAAAAALEAQIKKSARDIRDKYIHPPHSTDFAIMFLPVESLYAEVLRRPGLAQTLQRDFRTMIAGPTTLAALLNSLQMGFRTLAIQKSSSEVWKVLGGVKSEFGKFGDVLDKVGRQLQTAQNSIGEAAKKTRTLEQKLKSVEVLPAPDAAIHLVDGALAVEEPLPETLEPDEP